MANEDDIAKFAQLKFDCPQCSFSICLEAKGSKDMVKESLSRKTIPLSVFGEANSKKRFYADKLAEAKGMTRAELVKSLKPEYEAYIAAHEAQKLAKRQQGNTDDNNVSSEDDFLTDF
ncbi:MAG: hypothetical protein IT410_00820 [Candidatus Doudnabacteria bacterium]|nr:hypothetical protein [Candidatus Doudnabacteria bacterium]